MTVFLLEDTIRNVGKGSSIYVTIANVAFILHTSRLGH